MTRAGLVWRHTDPSSDVPEGQSRGQTFDPLFLNELFNKKGFDCGSRIAATSLDHGRDVRFNLIGVAPCLGLSGHRGLVCKP